MPRPLKYAWAFFPGTLIGLLFCPFALGGGIRCRVVRGCLELHGGAVTWFLRRGLPRLTIGGAAAMTLGHVILGQDETCLDRSRDHEHVHVRQYERWGPMFLPAYLAASVWEWVHGRNPYFDNCFEREAYDRSRQRT